MTLEEINAQIKPLDHAAMELAKKRWMSVAKPLFSLGKLEEAVILIAGIKGTTSYDLDKRALVIMCADNGVVEEGVTQTSQDVTAIVAENFTKQAASVCMMAEVADTDIFPVDIGMKVDVAAVTKKQDKVSYGTRNLAKEPAMTRQQAMQGIETGIRIAGELKEKGYSILAAGEMGIGNTTTSSAIAAVLLDEPPEVVTGRGAGLCSQGLEKKIAVIKKALAVHKPDREDPLDVLAKVGGLDIAGMAGLFLGGAIHRIPVVADGFISGVAALLAVRMAPGARDYILASHVSREPGGKMVLKALQMSPFLTCEMHLGEGSGAVAVFPLLEMGLLVYQKMSTFEEITVEQYEVLQ